MSEPLKGLKILDLTQHVEGGMCTLFFADFGAEVIRIENTKLQSNTMTLEEKCAMATFHRGKRIISLDTSSDDDKKILWELCEKADGIIEDIGNKELKRWGISYEKLHNSLSEVVLTSISGYGRSGPYAEKNASDMTIQAESGIMSITGERGKEPICCGVKISAYISAMIGCIGTMIALIDARDTGKGRWVDVSMMDCAILCLENQMAVYLKDGIVPKPMGNSYDLFAPVGLYHSGDGKAFMLSVGTDRQWKVLCEVLGRPEWGTDPRYITNMRRIEHLSELDTELRKEFKKYDRKELNEKLQAGHCVYGNINDLKDVAEHPQIQSREMIFQSIYPNGESFEVPGNPIHMSGMKRKKSYLVEEPKEKNGIEDHREYGWNSESEKKGDRENIEKATLLEGVRILDFTQFLSGPLCTLLLSDFGAEVIKIENPPLGDNTRYGPYIEKGVSSHYAMRNRGKKSIVLNMKEKEQKKLFWKLAKNADVVIDNYKPGTMEKFGITFDELKKINPQIIYTSISGYGQTGPYASHAAFDQTVQAESGVISITGEKGGERVKCGASIADVAGGLAACIGTVMGLYDVRRSGKGRRIDVAMMDSLVFGLENKLSMYLQTGKMGELCGEPGKYNDFEAVRNHPQVKARETFVDVVFPNKVHFQVPGNPIHMSGIKRKTEYYAATLGEHTYEVFREIEEEQTLHELFDPVIKEIRKEEEHIYHNS